MKHNQQLYNQTNFNKFICPTTKENLILKNQELRSISGVQYLIQKNGKINFINSNEALAFKKQRDFYDTLKALVKKMIGKHYMLFTYIVAPEMPRIHIKTLQTYWSYIVNKYSKDKELVIQIGSGNDRINNQIINIDIFDFPEVDIIADCTKLPFADNSIDGVVSSYVLEHVENPDVFIKEAVRVLKPGGFIITSVPFMQGFHASPEDYFRWTHKGLEILHQKHGFSKQETIALSGPTSGFLWVLQEWLAILFSFNTDFLYYFFLFTFMILLLPLKLLDLFLIYFQHANKINSSFLYIGKSTKT